eukprot:GHVR01132884.1.p1 GENE.GHVR01132884.1~~GHVR01132884.1.p1  ORF type:complete len:247 (+),score=104.78 GHVR01132884.1:34-774(+)
MKEKSKEDYLKKYSRGYELLKNKRYREDCTDAQYTVTDNRDDLPTTTSINRLKDKQKDKKEEKLLRAAEDLIGEEIDEYGEIRLGQDGPIIVDGDTTLISEYKVQQVTNLWFNKDDNRVPTGTRVEFNDFFDNNNNNNNNKIFKKRNIKNINKNIIYDKDKDIEIDITTTAGVSRCKLPSANYFKREAAVTSDKCHNLDVSDSSPRPVSAASPSTSNAHTHTHTHTCNYSCLTVTAASQQQTSCMC